MKNKAFLFSLLLLCLSVQSNSLSLDYYKHTCPEAENIVKFAIARALEDYPGIGAGIIRLLFHDCFVRGCDGSVLLDPSPKNPKPERSAPTNIGLRGFEIIDEAKRLVEVFCPGVVSCADILAYSARDAAEILNGIRYNVSGGRLDGKVSSASEAEKNLPPHTFNLKQLKHLFVKKKNMTTEDLVVLSGAHTLGRTHCSSITSRLYPSIDPTLDATFAKDALSPKCPPYAKTDGVVHLDHLSPDTLDSDYYKNVLDRTVVFFSDWSLLTSNETKKLVVEYATTPGDWEKDFAESMAKLSELDVITDPTEGEIRKNCRAVNY
ncbi:Peroxidase [Rhynchospora pubera]|uniref:Peroxidase n=1 Tax=Rhynchospora pubera TaxID=906938 RepID=A0AAV8CFY2_9POAL|nr:Peroxidase [Rhynchospora pubera]KAJ4793272.1 Peroxidase [Rhynchospora pubera]